jgi:hypothetical protein
MPDVSPVAATPRLSALLKMPSLSWSLPAVATCPGALDADGELVAACTGCYAAQGRYLFGAVKAVRDHNLADWRRPGWCDAMIAAIDADRLTDFRRHLRRGLSGSTFRHYFRWFDSGDIYEAKLAHQVFEVCRRTPDTAHWIPTRARKSPAVAAVLAKLERLENVAVRHSSDGVQGEELDGVTLSSTIVPQAGDFSGGKGRVECGAWRRGGKCGPCRACWSRNVAITAYPAHGRAVSAVTLARLLPQRSALLVDE